MKKILVVFMCSSCLVSGLAMASSKDVSSEYQKASNVSITDSKKQVVILNTADEQTLELLKGLSDSKAKAIVAYRDQHGKFATLDDLAAVHGIGEKSLKKLKADNANMRLN